MELPVNYNAFFQGLQPAIQNHSECFVPLPSAQIHEIISKWIDFQISVNVYLCRIPEVIMSNTMLPSGRTLFS